MTSSDKRKIDRLLDGFWDEVFQRFYEDPDMTAEECGRIAHLSEDIARRVLREKFSR